MEDRKEIRERIEKLANDTICPLKWKLNGIAGLFLCAKPNETRELSAEESNGICFLLRGIGDELEKIYDEMHKIAPR